MSQNITLLGASYSDVPAVTLPKTGGGTARFTDVTDTTATTADVAQGKYFHLASGERVAGTASGGGGDDTDFANTVMRSGAITRIPDSVTRIGPYAFYGCINLAITELPSGVTSIGTYAFRGCRELQQLDAQNVGTINANAFNSCGNLTELVLRKSNTACSLSNANAFTYTPMSGYNGLTGTVYVPQALISTYQTARNWSTLYNAGHLTFAAIEGSEYER